MQRSITRHLITALSVVAIPASVFAQTVLLSENFDGLALQNSIQEQVPGTNVWTKTPPVGWTVINDLPTPGMPEWEGWTFADVTWWATTAGDQHRTQFSNGLGTNVVAIVDPDEYDDANSPLGENPLYNSWLSTPVIDISAAVAGTVILTFDHSVRPEATHRQEITVTYDGGNPVTVLTMSPVGDGGATNHWVEAENGVDQELAETAQENASVVLPINNPAGATNMIITFAELEGANDWWWAIDNIVVTASINATAVDASGKLTTSWATIKSSR